LRRKSAIFEQNVRISGRYGLKSTKCSGIGTNMRKKRRGTFLAQHSSFCNVLPSKPGGLSPFFKRNGTQRIVCRVVFVLVPAELHLFPSSGAKKRELRNSRSSCSVSGWNKVKFLSKFRNEVRTHSPRSISFFSLLRQGKTKAHTESIHAPAEQKLCGIYLD